MVTSYVTRSYTLYFRLIGGFKIAKLCCTIICVLWFFTFQCISYLLLLPHFHIYFIYEISIYLHIYLYLHNWQINIFALFTKISRCSSGRKYVMNIPYMPFFLFSFSIFFLTSSLPFPSSLSLLGMMSDWKPSRGFFSFF